MQTDNQKDIAVKTAYKQLMEDHGAHLPKIGDVVTGNVMSVGKNEVYVDVDGIATGIARGYELIDESGDYSHLAVGDEVSATVLEMDNEYGVLELSFRSAGHKKAWDRLSQLQNEHIIIQAKITEANKGGLMVTYGNVHGFMPVSQLCPDHYPRIQGGDKNKILEKLKSYIGQTFDVKVIDVNEEEQKLIVSEKAAWEDRQKDVISSYKPGDVIEGTVTVITDFGVFVKFGKGLEGLVHISELAWQRIDDPKDFIQPGQRIKASIIKIDGSKIFLSMKKLVDDPWRHVSERYKIGQKVRGKVLKVNPFGLFVELDPEIHGLAHISELSHKQISDPHQIAQPGDDLDFIVVSVEPQDHRLGLSIKALTRQQEQKQEEQAPEQPQELKEEPSEEKEQQEKQPDQAS
ncbi:S1 RNA-binding domain-containing protein [Candidatus Uhrbacteria bacterium]|nr:S1 RNA-binding domain-containing protein [Candidatus Uhrbacteria bacterium]